MKVNQLDIKDSIRIIDKAQQQTEQISTGAAYYYKLWGLVLGTYFFIRFIEFGLPKESALMLQSFDWLCFVIGGILSGLRKKHDQAIEKVVPKMEVIYFYTFTGFALATMVVQFYARMLNTTIDVQLFPFLLGLTVYITGGITKHKPSIFLGLLSIFLCIPSLFLVLEYQFLMASLASIIGSFLPGVLMRNQNV